MSKHEGAPTSAPLSAPHNGSSSSPLVTWNGPSDPANPFNWPSSKKWRALSLGLLISGTAVLNGAILSVAHNEINEDFGVSDATFPNSYWPITSWGIGGALFPLILFPIMEDFGVRPVLLGTYFLFVCSLIPIGLATNFATLNVVRFFSGGFVYILGNAVGGIVSDIFPGDRARSIPLALYVANYMACTSVSPVIGAAILQSLGWRWIAYIELIWTAAVLPVLLVGLPETRASVILAARARKLRKEGKRAYTEDELAAQGTSKLQTLAFSIKRPLFMLFTEPVVFVATLWCAFSVGTTYLFTQSVEQVYVGLYGWDAVQAGYVQAAIVIGEILGLSLCLVSNGWYYASASRNTETPGLPIPEARLYPAMLGGFFGVTCGMLLYGWTAYASVHWVVPAVGLVMVGYGTTAVLVGVVNYLIDAYSKYAASALGAVGLFENTFLAFLPLATSSMYTTLGYHWASTLLGMFSLLLAASPLLVLKWGKEIRARSPFMKEAIIERVVEEMDEV